MSREGDEMMTLDDAFDAKLRAAFSRANERIGNSQIFVERLVKRLQREDRQRWWVLGGAASLGTIPALRAFSHLTEHAIFDTGLLQQATANVSLQTLAIMGTAAVMVMFGLMLPNRP